MTARLHTNLHTNLGPCSRFSRRPRLEMAHGLAPHEPTRDPTRDLTLIVTPPIRPHPCDPTCDPARVAAQRASELQVQNTPSLMHAGFGAFRGAVLLCPSIEAALRRHLQRASAEVMEKGGFTPESGRLMQQLIDFQGLLTA